MIKRFYSASKYRALTQDNYALELLLSEAQDERDAWKRAAEAAKEDLRMWRGKYELSQATPEVKADTEAAFKRGAMFAKQQALQNVMMMLTGLDVKEEQDV